MKYNVAQSREAHWKKQLENKVGVIIFSIFAIFVKPTTIISPQTNFAQSFCPQKPLRPADFNPQITWVFSLLR